MNKSFLCLGSYIGDPKTERFSGFFSLEAVKRVITGSKEETVLLSNSESKTARTRALSGEGRSGDVNRTIGHASLSGLELP